MTQQILAIAHVANTGQISFIEDWRGEASMPHGFVYDGKTIRNVYNLDGCDLGEYMNTFVWQDDAWVRVGLRPQGGVWDPINREWAVDRTGLMKAIRQERFMLLATSDWALAVDSPLTTEQKAEATTYRQALRDVPANVSDSAKTVEDASWPTRPSFLG